MSQLLCRKRAFLCLCVWSCMAWLAMAVDAQAQELHVSLDARLVFVAPDGSRRTSPNERARPGDLIEYQASYRNDGQRALRQVQATVPVPVGTDLDAAEILPPQASEDGQRFVATPLRAVQRLADGRTQWRELPRSAYRFLRWPLGDLAAGQTRVVRVLVRVRQASDTPAGAPAADVSAPVQQGARGRS
jgi:uncharacterized repeat protein (TIGR01451 family)